jgi:hypothetical protein
LMRVEEIRSSRRRNDDWPVHKLKPHFMPFDALVFYFYIQVF